MKASKRLAGRLWRIFITIPLCLGVAGNAWANLIEFRYESHQGVSRTGSPGDRYINPAGGIDFFVSGGVDRMVRMSIINGGGGVVETKTSHLLGADDRMSAAGSLYYGAILTLGTPVDGEYVLRSEILDANGNLLERSDSPVTIDTKLASFGAITPLTPNYGQYRDGAIWKLGTGGSGGGDIEYRITPSGSPIERVVARLYRQNGDVHFDRELNYDTANNRGVINHKTSWFFPSTNLDEVFRLRFEATDAAGNVVTSPDLRLMYDNVVDAPPVFGVYDPSASGSIGPGLAGYVPYQPGMTVKTNPIRLAYRIPRSNWHEYNEAGLRFVNSVGTAQVAGVDANYVYLTVTAPMGFVNHNQIRWVNFGSWGGAGISYDLVLSPSAPQTPLLRSVEYRYSDLGWHSYDRRNVQNNLLPITVDRVRLTVEPRPFVQEATHMGTCTIPAGASSCEIPVSRTMAKGTTGYLHDIARVWNSGRTLVSNSSYAEVNWNDLHYPELSYRYNEETMLLSLDVRQPSRGSYFDRLRLRDAWIEDSDGARLSPAGGLVSENGADYSFAWDLSSLEERRYSLFAVAQENHGPITRIPVFEYQGDQTPPQVTIHAESAIQSLDDVSIRVVDNYDDSPRVTHVRLHGGPADDSVSLSTRRISEDTFGLEYPIMFPSLQAGEEYTLDVVARDAHGNETSARALFAYEPRQVSLVGGVDGKLMIPAVQHEFRHRNGRRIIETEPLTLADGATVAGTYDVFASLRADAEVPLVVNGVRIEPGDTAQIMSRHDFGASEGKLSLPLMAAEHGLVGTSSLLVSTAAPNAPVLLLDVHTWLGEASLSADSWSVRQVVDPVRVNATPGSGNMCRFTASESEARAADPIHDPTCYLQWESLPDETDPVPLVETGANAPRAEGQAVALGEHEVAYSLWLFSGDGTKVKVGEGARVLEAISPFGAVTYRPVGDYSAVDRILEAIDLRLTQSSGPTCNLTLSAEEAIDAAANRKHDAQRLTCLLDWQTIPTGLRQHESGVAPRLRGHLAENGDYPVGWRVSVFSRGGTRLTLNREESTLTVVDPEAPLIDMLASRHVIDLGKGTYVVPIEGSHFADLDISALPTEVDLTLTRDEEVLEADTFGVGWSNRNRLTRRLNAPAKGLWETTDLSASVYYNRVPDIGTEVHYQTITGPAANVAPLIEVAGSEVLDNEPLPLAIQITDPFNPAVGYVPERMGEWEVRLANQRSLSERQPLSEWVAAEDGRVELELDLEGSDNANLRLVAEARLISPLEGFERLEVSPRPVFLTVLRGGAIDGEVQLRRLSGEAPFIAAFGLGFDNRLDQAALGDVVWEVSTDHGATWEAHEPDPRRKLTFLQTFDEGEYQVRAHLTNRHSGIESYTDTVEVIAYAVPKVTIEGPQTLFVGDSWTYVAGLALPDGSLADLSDVVVEWSLDGGDSWTHQGRELTLSRDEETRIGLRARARTTLAPEEDRDAFDVARATVEFRDVHPPRARVRGPLRVEPGESYTFTATVSPPYRGMAYAIDGYFTLPNGEVVEGVTEVAYTPTEADVASGRMEMRYTGWFAGWEADTRVEADHRSTVWEYIWPEFYFGERLSANVAPAEIALTVMHRRGTRRLEGPVYEWTLPEEARDVVDRGVTRIFWIDEPGTYPISVTVSDERGHTATVDYELVLGRPAPYDIELSYTASNRYERAPLDVRVRPSVRGGHPRDRIIGHRYLANGEVISEDSMYGSTTLDAGTHYLVYELTTAMGTVAKQILPIEVAENQPPVCALEVTETSRDWRVSADCQDPDGRVREYHWQVNGEEVGRSGYRLSLSKRDHESLPTVQVVAVDDAGDRSEPVQVP